MFYHRSSILYLGPLISDIGLTAGLYFRVALNQGGGSGGGGSGGRGAWLIFLNSFQIMATSRHDSYFLE